MLMSLKYQSLFRKLECLRINMTEMKFYPINTTPFLLADIDCEDKYSLLFQSIALIYKLALSSHPIFL